MRTKPPTRLSTLREITHKNFLQWPQPVKSDPKCRDPDKYYQYHLTHGYDTKNYFQLMNENERLIKKGHLKTFLMKVGGLAVG